MVPFLMQINNVLILEHVSASQLINTLSSSLLNPPTSKNITASKAWSLRSLQLVDRVLEEESTGLSSSAKGMCERARIVGEFNMGALLEVRYQESLFNPAKISRELMFGWLSRF